MTATATRAARKKPAPTAPFPADWTLADLCRHLGDIPPERIRLVPAPGTATEQDVLDQQENFGRLCELEDGILVEKPMGWYESIVAGEILSEIRNYLQKNSLGQVLGEGGSLQILPGKVKLPDVSFIGWKRFPKKKVGRRPIPPLIPDLAVEVFSETNTAPEMKRKLKQYFRAGVKLVWYIDPETRTAQMFTSPTAVTNVDEDGFLDGGKVLPGLKISLGELFRQADRQSPDE